MDAVAAGATVTVEKAVSEQLPAETITEYVAFAVGETRIGFVV